MNDQFKSEDKLIKIRLIFIIAGFIWISILVFNFFLNLETDKELVTNLAINQARTVYFQDLLNSRWIAMTGGIYIDSDNNISSDTNNQARKGIETKNGKKLYPLNPEYMSSKVQELAGDSIGVLSHITSLEPLDKVNNPDEWEKAALIEFQKGKIELYCISNIKNRTYLRFMKPIKSEKSCLKCHSYFQEGQTCGGFSISIPYESYQSVINTNLKNDIILFISLFLSSLITLIIGNNYLRNSIKKIKEQDELFRAMIAKAYDWEYWMDAKQNYKFISPSVEKITGYTSDEFIQNKDLIKNIIHPEDKEYFLNHLNLAFVENIDDMINFRIINKNNEIRWINHVCHPVTSSEGIKLGRRVINRDITDQTHSEIALRESEEKFSKAFQNSPFAFIISSIDTGLITEVNTSFTKISGYEYSEVVGKSTIGKGFWKNSDERKEYVKKLKASGAVRDYQAIFKMNNGNEITCKISSEVITIKNQYFAFSIVEDITETFVLQKKQKESEERFRNLFDLSPSGIIIHFNGKIILANKLATKLFGFNSSKDVIGLEIMSFVDTDYHNRVQDRIKLMEIDKTEVPMIEEKFIRLDGTSFYAEVVAKKINIDGADAFQVIFNDISERKNREVELLMAKQRAEESDKLKTSFLQNMSHEIRTPLNGIIGFSRLLKDVSPDEEEERNEYTDMIIQSGERLLAIINDVLELSKLDSGLLSIKTENFTLIELFKNLKDGWFQKAIEKNLFFEIDIPIECSNITLNTDKNKLLKIISSFLSNAVKFTDSGYVELLSAFDGDLLKIFVKDSGIGIKPEYQNKVFDRFWQLEGLANRRYGGTGLGLSISKELSNLLGLKISISSEFGSGSTFIIEIPKELIILNEVKEINIIYDKEFDLSNSTILIVDDEILNYILLEKFFKNSNLKLIWAKNGEEAVEIAGNNHVDLVLMDLKLPAMNGFEATKRIKAIKPKLPVIAQTAYSQTEEIESALSSGCDDFISKPIEKKALMRKIKDLLAN
ncbi:MAG: PAS domain S-box protein [Candidatus Kapabacteria bacterium]|nr:PAS domain S-box protein [Candidatus Kapabacteria bacterium]